MFSQAVAEAPGVGRYLVCGTRPRALPVEGTLARALRRLGVGAELVVDDAPDDIDSLDALLTDQLRARIGRLQVWPSVYLYPFEGIYVVMPIDRDGRYRVESHDGPLRLVNAERAALRIADRLTLPVAYRAPTVPLRLRRPSVLF
ncbi:MAG: hypothetical protein H6704_09855 [Myxococcales bacterium]|nr:hypothetical protein [Myxococcales bacterium]MCB9536559.1 hypothetical protein [Myxococcales bacterium]